MMQSLNDNIYPIFNQIISKREKENRLNQYAKCIWLTGLSGSGKTTLALRLEKELFKQGYLVQILDGDNIRAISIWSCSPKWVWSSASS